MDFDCCDTTSEFENALKGFTRAWVSTGPRGCSNATTDRNIDITRNVRTLPAMKQGKKWFQSRNTGRMPVPSSVYALVRDIARCENPTSTPSPLSGRDFEGLDPE